jgi:hypothetical protein
MVPRIPASKRIKTKPEFIELPRGQRSGHQRKFFRPTQSSRFFPETEVIFSLFPSGGSRFLRRITPALFLICAGCSINGTGTVKRDIIPVAGGWIDRHQAVGLHIRSRRDGVSLTLGRYDGLFLFSGKIPIDRTSFSRLTPDLEFTSATGLNFVVAGHETGLSAGFHESLRLRPIAASGSEFRRLSFSPRRPEDTFIYTDFCIPGCGAH